MDVTPVFSVAYYSPLPSPVKVKIKIKSDAEWPIFVELSPSSLIWFRCHQEMINALTVTLQKVLRCYRYN